MNVDVAKAELSRPPKIGFVEIAAEVAVMTIVGVVLVHLFA
ncbi:MAG: hypothetical protein ACWA5K_00765 [bacterium]